VHAAQRRIDLRAHEALLIAPGVWHRHEPVRPHALWLGIDFTPVRGEVAVTSADRSWHGHFPVSPCQELILAAFLEADADEQRALTIAAIQQLLHESVSGGSQEHATVSHMVGCLDGGVHRGLTVEKLVKSSGCSRTRAYQLFTAAFRITPKRAIEIARLWLALGLLGRGFSVNDIALRAGYPNRVTFTRSCKRALHRTPGLLNSDADERKRAVGQWLAGGRLMPQDALMHG
jgi:AraC-like DNA-binding protein